MNFYGTVLRDAGLGGLLGQVIHFTSLFVFILSHFMPTLLEFISYLHFNVECLILRLVVSLHFAFLFLIIPFNAFGTFKV